MKKSFFFLNRNSVLIQDTRRLSPAKANCPSLILEPVRRREGAFWIHPVCHNCYFTLLRRKNLWVAGKGLAIPKQDPFGTKMKYVGYLLS